jgi:GR25 family glycosyltransferase involved in LPS biosynthesis
MFLFVVLFSMITFVLVEFFRRQRNSDKDKYDYKCFLLTLPDSTERQEKFFKSHQKTIPIETVYGINTKNMKNVREYENIIEPEYFEKALEMHYDPTVKRPDITYFNIGAIGAFLGHISIMKKSIEDGVKYALIFEDNVVIKKHRMYDEVQAVIDTLGDNFEMCFFHCLSRKPVEKKGDLEKVVWISSMKCYLINVKNMQKYMKYYFPIDNHVDNKTEDLIARGARVYYKDLRNCMKIDRSGPSTIGHSDHGMKNYFSRQNPSLTPSDIIFGY